MDNKETESVISAKELRLRYKDRLGNSISESTWCRWLKPHRTAIPKYTKLYTPKQVKYIYDHLGEP